MGVAGGVDFVQASAVSWVNCFILLASLLIVWIECHASYAMMRGRNWGRWAFVGCQAVVVSYMLLASFEWFGPKIFRFETETQGQFLHALLMQKVPDMVVLLLLFAPQSSRQFFLRRRAAFQAAR